MHAAAGIGLDRGGRADQLQLQVPVHALGVGQGVDLVTHLFPLGLGVQPQAAGLVGVVGDDQAVAGTRDELAGGGRDRQPALVVDGDCRLALEHACPFHKKPRKARISLGCPR